MATSNVRQRENRSEKSVQTRLEPAGALKAGASAVKSLQRTKSGKVKKKRMDEGGFPHLSKRGRWVMRCSLTVRMEG